MLTYIISIAALVISLLALIVSILSHRNNVKQTKIMQEQLKEQQKPKFTDEPFNPYTVKLDAIKDSIYNVAFAINDLKSKK